MSFRTAVEVPQSHAEWFTRVVGPIVPDTLPYSRPGALADLFPEDLQLALIEMWVEGPTDDEPQHRLDDWVANWAFKLRQDEARDAFETVSIVHRSVYLPAYMAPDSYIVQECIYLCSPKYQRLIELMMLRGMDVSKAARELGMAQQTASRWWLVAKVELEIAYVTVTSRSG